jgi:hypothetical protein
MTKGRKPKPSHLRLVDGTHRSDRHGDAGNMLSDAAAAFGPLRMPAYFKRQARVAWQRYITPASWLDASREPAAIAFCELWQELRSAPASFRAAKHSQLRAYMSDLGLTDERNRTVEIAKAKDEFFDD